MGVLAVGGTVAVGAFSLFGAIVAADQKNWEAAGTPLIAAALAFGLLANALWRK